MLYDITASLVVYRNNPEDILDSVKSFLDTKLKIKIFIIDNSPLGLEASVLELRNEFKDKLKYVIHFDNKGFGAAHNIVLKEILERKLSKYHVILNPDIWFYRGTLEKLYSFMEEHPEVGQVMPKVLYENGSLQPLCKRLPSPIDLIGRRFLPKRLKGLLKKRLEKYECWDIGYDHPAEIPALSGCFMFLRTKVLEEVGLFDENYFMYMEDFDLCRRIGSKYETVYYPEATVYHRYGGHSYKNKTLLGKHISSSIKYFRKWGWFLDLYRDVRNISVRRFE